MYDTRLRGLLPFLLLLAISAQAQRPAPAKAAPRPPAASAKVANAKTANAKVVKPAVRALPTEQAQVLSVADTSSGRFVVPQVQLPDAAVAARVNQALVDAALGEDLKTVPEPFTALVGAQQAYREYEASGQSGFMGASYEILYNARGLLSVKFMSEYLEGYLSVSTRYATCDLRSGRLLEVRDLVADTLALRQGWQQAITQRVAEHLRALPTAHPELDTLVLADVQRRLYWNDSTNTVQLEAEEPRFADFALTPLGVTLYYDFGFPHTMQALQPAPGYAFSYAELAAWLNPTGPLAPRR